MKEKIISFKQKYPDIYEFLMFNIMSNVATITNFFVLWLTTSVLFQNITRDFNWFIFNYNSKQGGLGAFMGFVIAYIISQFVNYFIQRKVVFSSSVNLKDSLPWYILTVTIAGIISVWLPPYVISITQPYIGAMSPFIANVVNLFIQVAINYPMMKFVIMKEGE